MHNDTAQPISNWNDPSFQYIVRMRHNDDALGLTVKGHLIIEYLLNEIIKHQCKAPSKILEDHRTYTFAVKLQLLYAMKLMPEGLYRNVQTLNSIRNQYAHNLDVNANKLSYDIRKDDNQIISCRAHCRKRRYPEREFIKLLVSSCLTSLRNHFYALFHEFPVIPFSDK